MVKSEERDAAPVSAPTIGRNDIFKSETQRGATVNENALQAYGQNSDIEELGDRVKRFLPNGNKMSAQDALGLAQIAIAQDLNPFSHEIWFVPGVGILTGIEGYRKLARRVANYTATTREMTNEERTKHSITSVDFGAVCELYRPDVLREAIEINKAAGTTVIPVTPTLGIGIKRPNEKNAFMPNGRSFMWVAEKRAEADALRKAFDIQVGFAEAYTTPQETVTVIDDEPDTLPAWATEELAKGSIDDETGGPAEEDWDEDCFDAGEEPEAPPDPEPSPIAGPRHHAKWGTYWKRGKALGITGPVMDTIAGGITIAALTVRADALKEAIAQREADLAAAKD